MKFWIEKQNPLKIWKHNFPIINDFNLQLNYCSPSDGKYLRIEDDNHIVAEFDLNGRIKLFDSSLGKFANAFTFPSSIRQRIIIKNNKFDLVEIETPARSIHLGTDINN